MVLAALGFVISINTLNVDGFIVKQNIQREIRSANDKSVSQGSADLDAQYFLDLSDDAVPVLTDAFLNKSLPLAVNEKVGAALTCKRYLREQEDQGYLWQSFHFSRYNADLAFAKIDKKLDAYQISDKDFPVTVTTPSGEEFFCYQYYYD